MMNLWKDTFHKGKNVFGGILDIIGTFKIDDVEVVPTVAELNRLVNFPGNHAMATIDFNAVGTAAMKITINGVIYQEADAAVPASGIWTNGASAADSATSLIAAINGDTRAAVPFTAIADVSGDGILLVCDAVGVAGNAYTLVSSTGDATVEATFLLGEEAAIKEVTNITKTVDSNDVLAGAVEIALPFAPTGYSLTCVSATGAPIYQTGLVTIETAPNRISIDVTTGATNLADTNVIHLTAWE